ncbi:MAG: HNH endonuclease [Mediterraneibacter sp.]
MNRQVFGGSNSKPTGYTWHHLEDGESMLLVNTKIHSKFHHQGGAQGIRSR